MGNAAANPAKQRIGKSHQPLGNFSLRKNLPRQQKHGYCDQHKSVHALEQFFGEHRKHGPLAGHHQVDHGGKAHGPGHRHGQQQGEHKHPQKKTECQTHASLLAWRCARMRTSKKTAAAAKPSGTAAIRYDIGHCSATVRMLWLKVTAS